MGLRFARSLALFPFVVALACSSSPSQNNNGDAGTDGGTKAFVARFEIPASGTPDFLQIPFPSDVYLKPDGTIAFPLGGQKGRVNTGAYQVTPVGQGAQFIVDSFAFTRGYGVYAGALFALDGSVPDATKLPTGKPTDCMDKNAAAALVDLDDGTLIPCQAAYHDDAQPQGTDVGTTPTLNVRPARGHVLKEGHHIAAVITSRIVDTSGKPLTASTGFAALRDGTRSSALATAYGSAIDTVVAKTGIDKSTIVGAAVYTTGTVSADLRAAREVAGATPLPTLKWDSASTAPVAPAKFTNASPLPAGWTASLDAWLGKSDKLSDGSDDPNFDGNNPGVAHDAIAAVGTAEFDAPNLLISIPDQTYNDPSHGTLYRDASGKVAINPKKPTAKIWVTFAVPTGTMPANGWPVVIMQHGLGGDRSDIFEMANTFAKQGWATAAIEIQLHGTRAADAGARGDSKADIRRSSCTYDGPDGFTDKDGSGGNAAPNDFFGSLYRIAAMRDQFRHTAIDHTSLVRLLASSPTLDGLAQGGVTPKIDGTKIAYTGDSLGGITGAITAGIEPTVSAYVLNVPGGALLTEVASNSPVISALLNGSASLYFGLNNVQLPPEQAMVQLFQHVMDGGDPISVAGTVINPVPIAGKTPKPRNVVMMEVLADELVSNQSTEALARAMGVPILKPHGSNLLADLAEVDGASLHDVPTTGITSFVMQLYPAQHGYDMYGKSGQRTYAKDRPLFNDASSDVFPKLHKSVTFTNPYLDVQKMLTKYIADAFAGKAPTVSWTTAPAAVTDG